LAVLFLLGADKNRYGKMMDELEDAQSQGRDNYPVTMVEAYQMILHHKDLGRSSSPIITQRQVVQPGPVNDVTLQWLAVASKRTSR
jgi:hypothetical protein